MGLIVGNNAALPVAAGVATSQTTASTTYADLATVGPAVTVTTGTSALVILTQTFVNTGANVNYASFAVSGATTLAASDTNSSFITLAAGVAGVYTATVLVTGLTAGSNTFTAKYRTTAGTATFADRRMTVIPL